MSVSEQPTVVCQQCQKQYKWKPELAGRSIRCRCGHVMKAPAPPAVPPAKADDEDGLYDIAPDPESRPAGAPQPQAEQSADLATPAASSGTSDDVLARLGLPPQKVSHLTEEMLAEDRAINESRLKEDAIRDIIVPIVLIGTGTALSFYEMLHVQEQAVGTVAAAIPQVLMRLGMSIGLMLAAAFLAVMFLEITLIGSFRQSILKLCAIAVGPAAVHGILASSVGDIGGSMIGVLSSVAAYALLFWYLLRLSAQDTAILVLVAWILIAFANYMAYTLDGILRDSWI